MDKKFAKHRANCCALFRISTLWNCHTRKFAAVRREPTTLRRPKHPSSYSTRKCVTPSPPGPRSWLRATPAVSCNSAPELPSTERTKTSFMSLNYSTAPSCQTRVLPRNSVGDRLRSLLRKQAAALWPPSLLSALFGRVHPERPPARYVIVRPFVVNVISKRAGGILPDIGLQKPSRCSSSDGFFSSIRTILYPLVSLSAAYHSRAKRQRPSRSDGGCREKGVPSSGEKIVLTKKRREQSIVPRRRRLVVVHSSHPLATLRY